MPLPAGFCSIYGAVVLLLALALVLVLALALALSARS